MIRRRLLLATTIIAGAILIAFVLTVPHTRDLGFKPTLVAEPIPVPVVFLRDSYKKGVHTFTGALNTKNPCTQVSATASLVLAGEATSTATGIVLAVSAPLDTGVCLQVPMRSSFQVTLSAPSGLPLSVTVNGETASTTPL